MARDKRALVTGGCGFIGSNFVRHVIRKFPEWSIVNLDAFTYSGRPMNLSNLEEQGGERYGFIRGDIREKNY